MKQVEAFLSQNDGTIFSPLVAQIVSDHGNYDYEDGNDDHPNLEAIRTDDEPSILLYGHGNDLILETPPFSDDDNSSEDLFFTPPSNLFPIHEPSISDEE